MSFSHQEKNLNLHLQNPQDRLDCKIAQKRLNQFKLLAWALEAVFLFNSLSWANNSRWQRSGVNQAR